MNKTPALKVNSSKKQKNLPNTSNKKYDRLRVYQLGWIGLGAIALIYLFSLIFDTSQPNSQNTYRLQANEKTKRQLLRNRETVTAAGQINNEIRSLRQDIGKLRSQIDNLTQTRQNFRNTSSQGELNETYVTKTATARKDNLLTGSAYNVLRENNNYGSAQQARYQYVQPTKKPALPRQSVTGTIRNNVPNTDKRNFHGYVINNSQKTALQNSRQFNKPSKAKPKKKVTPKKVAKPKKVARVTKTMFGIQIARGRTYRGMRRHWGRLRKKYPSRLKGLKPRLIKSAKKQKNPIKLIAGPFSNIAKALEVCAVIKRKLNCELTHYK